MSTLSVLTQADAQAHAFKMEQLTRLERIKQVRQYEKLHAKQAVQTHIHKQQLSKMEREKQERYEEFLRK